MHVLGRDDDRVPLIPSHARAASARPLRFKAAVMLSLCVGMSLYFLAATKMLLGKNENKPVTAVPIQMRAALELPLSTQPTVTTQSPVPTQTTQAPLYTPASTEPLVASQEALTIQPNETTPFELLASVHPLVTTQPPITTQPTSTVPPPLQTIQPPASTEPPVESQVPPTTEPTATSQPDDTIQVIATTPPIIATQPTDVPTVQQNASTESPATTQPTVPPATETSPPEPISVPFNRTSDGSYSDYVCVGWRQTGGCSPDGPREPEMDEPCDAHIISGLSGFCEIQHRVTGERRRVLPMHCDSTYYGRSFSCGSFEHLLGYGINAVKYTHDEAFSYAGNQDDLLIVNSLDYIPKLAPDSRPSTKPALRTVAADPFFHRGIVMVDYEKLLLGAYVSVRHLREMGSTLPVEMWYRPGETDPNHPLLKLLVADYNVYLRELTHPLATGFYTKLHAVFYSAFDQVLLLDADNYAVRDPTYLFDTSEFTSTGAMFWPDFWRPGHTLFNVHNQSLVWQVFDLPYVDMFEQESGQVLIDRRRHMTALNVLMYYGFSLPRIHEKMRLVWGDKDLFRFAWMKTNSSFHMIARPPGSAGKLKNETNQFCGLTMVQHDPQGEIVFLHRNSEKLLPDKLQFLWTHVQQFKRDAPISEYRIEWAQVFPDDFESCWAKASDWEKLYDFTPMSELPFGGIESTLLRLAHEGIKAMAAPETPTPTPLPSTNLPSGSSDNSTE